MKNLTMSTRYFLNALLAAALLSNCKVEIYPVIDTNSPIIVKYKVSENRYRVDYNYAGTKYFMEIITQDSLNVGDTLKMSR